MAPVVLNKRAQSGIDFELKVVRMEKIRRPGSGNSSVQHCAVKVVTKKGDKEVAFLIEMNNHDNDNHCAKELQEHLQGKAHHTEGDGTRILLFQDSEAEWKTEEQRAGFSELTLGQVFDAGCQTCGSNELQNACWDVARRMWDATFSRHICGMRELSGIDFKQTVVEVTVVSRPLDPHALAKILHALSSARQLSTQGFHAPLFPAYDKESQSATVTEQVLAVCAVVAVHKACSINHQAALVRCKGEGKNSDKLYIIEKGLEISSDHDPAIRVCYREMKSVKKGCRIYEIDNKDKLFRTFWSQDKRCPAVEGITLENVFDAGCGFDGSECTARAAELKCQYSWYFDNCWNAVERVWNCATGRRRFRTWQRTWQLRAICGVSAAGTTYVGCVVIKAVLESQRSQENKRAASA